MRCGLEIATSPPAPRNHEKTLYRSLRAKRSNLVISFKNGDWKMLELQILFLTLIPVFSGIVPQDGLSGVSPSALLGIAEPVTAEFIQGTWQTSDEFFKWGVTDREKATLRPFRKTGFVKFNKDGTMRMVNFFQPSDGQWEITNKGLILKDPRYPEAPQRLVPIRKRDDNRIWMLIPFSRGAIGIGLERTNREDIPIEESPQKIKKRTGAQPLPPAKAQPRGDTAADDDQQQSTDRFVVPQWGEYRNDPLP